LGGQIFRILLVNRIGVVIVNDPGLPGSNLNCICSP